MPDSSINATRADPCRILVIHDDLGFQSAFWRVAASAGHVVTALTAGRTAVEVARRLFPDLVLLNLDLRGPPGRDGRDILAALKADPGTVHIPVLAYRQRAQGFDKRHALELGAEDLLPHPMDPDAVIAKIERIVLRTSSGKFRTSHE